MPVRPILLLGDARLYQVSSPVAEHEREAMRELAGDLHDTMAAFQAEHGWGRAISAPQIGVHKRVVCMNLRLGSGERLTMLNPVLDRHSDELLEHWEDCMSFPELLVRLLNPRSCRLRYRDLDWREHEVELSDDYAELLQHEVDHLDGVLSVERAIDARSIVLRRAMPASLDESSQLRGEFRVLR